jgi:hypothetical protein
MTGGPDGCANEDPVVAKTGLTVTADDKIRKYPLVKKKKKIHGSWGKCLRAGFRM